MARRVFGAGLGFIGQTFSRFGKPVMSGGAVLLAKEAYDYFDLRSTLVQQLRDHQFENPADKPLVDATDKEWLLIGRQSPGYVRDPKKNPKNHLIEKISRSKVLFSKLGTHFDNEKHYDLFVGSDFVVEPFSSNPNEPRVRVAPEMMLSTDLHLIDDDDKFEAGFSRKQGFADISQRSPFYHSSLAFRKLKPGEAENPDKVILSGKEIKGIFNDANQTICESQACNLLISNCYSGAILASALILEHLNHRCGEQGKDPTSEIEKVFPILANAAMDNAGRGVTNNRAVSSKLQTVCTILRKQNHQQPEITMGDAPSYKKFQ